MKNYSSPSSAYSPAHGGRTERSIMLSSSIVALMLYEAKRRQVENFRRIMSGGGGIRANDRRIRNAGGGPC